MRTRGGRTGRWRWSLPLLAAALGGCAGLRPPELPVPGLRRAAPAYTQQDLGTDLAEFSARFAAVVSAAADEISAASTDREVRRRALLWKVRLVPMVREAAHQPDSREAFVDTLTVVAALVHYLREGDGREAFGDRQQVALEAAAQLVGELRAIGERFLSPKEIERVRQEVDELSRRYAIRGPDFATQAFQRTLSEVEERGMFRWVFDVPMAPVRALEGVGSGAEAIHEFNQTAARFSDVVAHLPEQVRWEVELLLFEAEARDTVVQGLAAFETLAESARRTSLAIDRLPGDLRAGLSGSARTLDEVQATLASARELLGPLGESLERARAAGEAWADLLEREPGEAERAGRPFDVREWESAAREIGTTAAELRTLAVELRTLSETEALGRTAEQVDVAVGRAEEGARSVVDAAAWRGLQLLVAFFVLLLAYRLVASRLARS